MTSAAGPDPQSPTLDVAIIGGGISGLVTAFRLSRERESAGPLSVRLFEADHRPGGVVRTERVAAEDRGDCLCEAGPDSMVTTKTSAIDLCRELGLADSFSQPRSAASYSVVHDRRLHPLPSGFRLIAPTEPWPLFGSRLFTWRGKVRMLLEPRVTTAPVAIDESGEETAADESVESFVRRRFGSEAFERVAEPVLGGLFVADATKLSAERALGPFVELERHSGSVLRGLRGSSRSKPWAANGSTANLTLDGGLGSLVERLVAEIPAKWLELDCGATRVQRRPGGSWLIRTVRGDWSADAVVLACPAPLCSELLRPSEPALANALAGLRFASCVTVNLVYRRGDVAGLPKDFGFFVPRREPYHIRAATFASEKFPGRAPDGFCAVRTFQGGALDPAALDVGDEALVARSHADLLRLIGVDGKPVAWKVSRFPGAVPQFDVGYRGCLAELKREVERHRGLHLAGSALGAYGLADCVASGEAAAALVSKCRRDES